MMEKRNISLESDGRQRSKDLEIGAREDCFQDVRKLAA